MKNNIYSLRRFNISSEAEQSIRKLKMRKEKMYASDFKLFIRFCETNELPIDFESMDIICISRLLYNKLDFPLVTVELQE